MSVIISSNQTWLECDEPGCRQKSQPISDQTEAVTAALKAGWFKSQTTGHVTCPICRHKPLAVLCDAPGLAASRTSEEIQPLLGHRDHRRI